MKLPTFSIKPKLPKLRLRNFPYYLPVLKFVVKEDSMRPTLYPGDAVLAVRFLPPRRGDVVVVRHTHNLLIKRVQAKTKGKYFLLGDNPRNSFDSRRFGPVEKKDILGVVFYTRALPRVDNKLTTS